MTKDIHISPEGVEEEIVDRCSFMVTRTQNNKFRVYFNDSPKSGIIEKEKSAKLIFAELMVVTGSLIINPHETIEMIKGIIKNDRNSLDKTN